MPEPGHPGERTGRSEPFNTAVTVPFVPEYRPSRKRPQTGGPYRQRPPMRGASVPATPWPEESTASKRSSGVPREPAATEPGPEGAP
jgi:hypothetical protein